MAPPRAPPVSHSANSGASNEGHSRRNNSSTLVDVSESSPQLDGINIPQPQAPADRLKTISFSSSTSLPKRQGSYGMSGTTTGAKPASPAISPRGEPQRLISEEHDVADSSADETTAIMKKSPQGYGATRGGLGEGIGERDSQNRKKLSFPGRGRTDKVNQPNGRPEGQTQESAGEKEGWWKSFVEKYGSVELENKGSVARDHLALERTFLAWLRTSLSFASIGVAVTQLFRLNSSLAGRNGSSSMFSPQTSDETEGTLEKPHHLRRVGKPLGATFLAISILILLLGFHRYFESQHYVIRGKFPASRGSILIVTFVAASLIVASLVIVVTVAPSAFDV